MTPDPIEEAVARAILADIERQPSEGGMHGCLYQRGHPEEWDVLIRGHVALQMLARAAIAAHLAALEAAGFVVVSADAPTEAMATLAKRVCLRREERLRALDAKRPAPA